MIRPNCWNIFSCQIPACKWLCALSWFDFPVFLSRGIALHSFIPTSPHLWAQQPSDSFFFVWLQETKLLSNFKVQTAPELKITTNLLKFCKQKTMDKPLNYRQALCGTLHHIHGDLEKMYEYNSVVECNYWFCYKSFKNSCISGR